jgi:hypothetical protein
MQKRTRAKKQTHPRARARSAKRKRDRSNNSNKAKTVLSRLRRALDDTAAKLKGLLPGEAERNPRVDANEMS